MTQTIFKNVIPFGVNPVTVYLPSDSTFLGVIGEKGFVTVYVSAPSVEPTSTYTFDLLGVGESFDDTISRQLLGIAYACGGSRVVYLRT